MMKLFEDVKSSLAGSKIEKIINSSKGIVCALSGGADSVCLLLFLKEYIGKIPLYAFHVNHMIRGHEADRDEEFCRKLCKNLNVDFNSIRINIPEISINKSIGTEECARIERYKALFKFANEKKAIIATAHNSSDNAETVLFNLVRGSGVKGISGISPVRNENGIYIVRPLISVTGESIRSFLNENSQEYVFDSTNSDNSYTRNYLRNTIIPGLKSLNPELEKAVLRLSVSSREAYDYINGKASDIVKNDKYLKRELLKSIDLPVLKECISEIYRGVTGNRDNLNKTHINDSCSFILSNRNGEISLPQNVTLYIQNEYVYAEKSTNIPCIEEIVLCKNTFFEFGCYKVGLFTKDVFRELDKNIYNLFIYNLVNCGNIINKVTVRTRKSGDVVLEHNVNKKVKNLMCDRKLPQHLRDTWPIFVDDMGIICIPNVAIRDSAYTKTDDNACYLIMIKE